MLLPRLLLVLSALMQVASAIRGPMQTFRWNLDLLRQGRTPMRMGVDLELRENGKGKGLYAMRTLEQGSLVGRYTGVEMKWEDFEKSGSLGTYAMTLANGGVVDGADEKRSSFVRYINHSVRRANCEAHDAWEESDPMAAVYIETSRRILPGEELLFDCTSPPTKALDQPSPLATTPCLIALCSLSCRADGTDYWDELGVPRFSPKRLVIDYF